MTEQNTTLRQANNNVSIEGLLLEKKVHEGTTQTGSEYLSVDLTIAVSDTEQHQVSLFSTKLKKDGTENGIYASLRTVADDYKAAGDEGVGKDQADYVTINQGELRVNDYVGQDGQLRSFPQINATFVNRVEGREPNPHAKFDVEMVVANAVEEVVNDEETGRTKVKGYIPLYGGRIAPMEFVVTEEGASFVLDNYENGSTVQVWGDLINKREETVTEVEGAFGGNNKKKTYTTVREQLVTGGTEPYDEDSPKAYDTELIKKALNEREVYLEELVAKNKEKKTGAKQGFGDNNSAPKKKRDVSGDLPF